MKTITSQQAIILNAIASALIMSLIVLLFLVVRDIGARLNRPDLPFSIDEVPTVVNPNVCPGSVLEWPLTITYYQDAILLDITRNVRNLDTGDLAIVDGSLYMSRVFVPQETAGVFKRNARWLVPQLPPANYRLITTTQSATGSRLIQYYVNFKIREDCGKAENK